MDDRATETVRRFCAAWADEDPAAPLELFGDDAVWVDGSRGEHRGKAAISSELLAQRIAGGPVDIQIRSILSDGHLVLTERLDTSTIGGLAFPLKLAAAFDVDDDGLITRWQDYFDFESFLQQLRDAGIPIDERTEAYEELQANHSTGGTS